MIVCYLVQFFLIKSAQLAKQDVLKSDDVKWHVFFSCPLSHCSLFFPFFNLFQILVHEYFICLKKRKEI